jgi:hypothetical protein
MTEKTFPTFTKKCEILSDLWFDYRQDEQFQDFIEYNDLGLPLAYAIHGEIVQATELAKQYINETFELFAFSLEGVDPDEDWQSLDEMLEASRDNDLGSMPE